MSVQRFRPPSDPEAWLSNEFRRRPCYYCAEPMKPPTPFVMWMGAGEPIGLHPACTVELTIRLIRDVHQIECETHTDITRPSSKPLDQLADLRTKLDARNGGTP